MKRFLKVGIAGICLMLPGLSKASTVDFVVNGSSNVVMFDPHGCDPSTLPPTLYYRSYDCRIGSKPPTVILITKPTEPTTPPVYPVVKPPVIHGDNPPVIQPVIPPTEPPCDPVAIPVPASSGMAGVGLAAAAIFAWLRGKRQARLA